MFATLLIANRGEIARRIIRTARRLGIETVAVYSDADADAWHVREADAAVRLGPAAAGESYLKSAAILAAAKDTGADAIHPGYGFLSENAGFADACAKAGVTFVGPPAAAIRAMGRKDEAKTIMAKAGVPVTPGHQGDDQSAATLKAAAADVGYPVLIKAVAGGGGKGMRKVDKAADFDAALESAKREAVNAFGDDRVLIEKFITGPRHIEVQVFGDTHGGAVHFFERDCSLQRRHQKVIEEAPAPGMTDAVRAAMCDAAVRAAKAVDYVGAGTVEFIVDGSKGLKPDGFWFMEMNTRLQVEHPVTEMITGRDLVELQLRVAAGEKLPAQSDIAITGHAMEARLYAEDPRNGFLPSIGALDTFRLDAFAADGEPADAGDGTVLRLDSAVEEGDAISPHYDPMIAKAIAHGRAREAARGALAEALAEARIFPARTNTGFLVRALTHPDFAAAALDTGFIDARIGDLVPALDPGREACLGAAVESLIDLAEAGYARDPWAVRDGWRLNAPPRSERGYEFDGARFDPAATPGGDGVVVRLNGDTFLATPDAETAWLGRDAGELVLWFDAAEHWIAYERVADGLVLFRDGDAVLLKDAHPEVAAEALEAGDDVLAPMPGKVLAVKTEAGRTVAKGDTLLVLEAMKMEHALMAPRDGVVDEVRVGEGDQVSEGAVLAKLAPEA